MIEQEDELRHVIESILLDEKIVPTKEAVDGFILGQKVAFCDIIDEVYKTMARKYGEPVAKQAKEKAERLSGMYA